MRREVTGRLVISCDRCNARLDLGPAHVNNHLPRRMPSGWLTTGDNQHLCTVCSPRYTSTFVRRFG